MLSTTSFPPVIVCVGGSDPSAHAGLQADIRVGQDLGVHVTTVVSALTAQNSQSVLAVYPVEKEQFDRQWESILADMTPGVVKIGLLPNAELASATAFWLRTIKTDYPACRIVFDPVGVSSTGHRLHSFTSGDPADSTEPMSWLKMLLPLVDWVTPNTHEFEQIVQSVSTIDQPINRLDLVSKFDHLLAQYPELRQSQWVIKGGHAHNEAKEQSNNQTGSSSRHCVDWLFSEMVKVDGLVSPFGFSSKRQENGHSRGTGCSFATALSSFLALGYDEMDSLTLTKSYINHALSLSYQVGKNTGPLATCGWPSKIQYLPDILQINNNQGASNEVFFPEMEPRSLGLYPVVDTPEWIERLLKAGVTTVQLRVKDPNSATLEQDIRKAIALGEHYQAQVFINDYWQKAIEFGAYGVHLGQEDLLTADLDKVANAGLRLGVSTHGYFEIARAGKVHPSYIALGHIFPTQTKDMPSQPQGTTRLQKYANLLSGVYPTVAIGGINSEVFDAVLDTGVDGIAMVTAITRSANPEQIVTDFMRKINASNASNQFRSKG
ncbi:thiamine phosphate synthase [Marinomonas sp. 15G1-11]|uniref:Thiamine-phosphate synthase n=1 Tax=Marinomonas phaeophyticola TaxID=3004091 RepID=A0ABT4JXH9_9GAMM|nr:thiamine phosphate synthase [Marinomonas sp. 15G1-11]MCZ2722926.1 thiamine phosphate synthase [Marinomonas sp. 15G1-11]